MSFKNDSAEFVYTRTYSRWREDLGRREIWSETVSRFMQFIQKERGDLVPAKVFKKMQEKILNFDVMPSMRALWAAGEAAKQSNVTLYNCSFLAVDSIEAFSECLYILCCGTGVGFSVESKYVERLPVVKPLKVGEIPEIFYIPDSKEGWSDSVKTLISRLYHGQMTNFDYSLIRPKGTRLKTMGGRASGPEPIILLHGFIKDVFNKAQGRKLSTLECHDIMNKIAEIVVVGGVRRSSEISLSDLSDESLRHAKDWPFPDYRTMANNSAVYHTKPSAVEFLKEWSVLASSGTGERGISNLGAARNMAPKRRNGELIAGFNPSLRAGTRIWTKEYGMAPIETLENNEFTIKNLHGEHARAKCFLSGKNKSLIKLTFEGGFEYFCTPEHKWPILDKDGKVFKKDTTQLEKGDLMPRFGYQEKISDGNLGTFEDGKLIGYFYGDGWITDRKDSGKRQYGVCIPLNNPKKMQYIEKYKKLFNGEGSKHKSGTLEFNSTGQGLHEWFLKFGVDKKEYGLPKKIWKECSDEFINGFIEGLFDADGCQPSKTENRTSIVSHFECLIRDLQNLLGFKGIYLNLSVLKLTSYQFKNKKYIKDMVRFTLRRKWDLAMSGKPVKLINIEDSGLKENVWDITVDDDTHCFQLAGVITGNCHEIALRNQQFCNLSSVIVRPSDDLDSLLDKVETATWIGVIQATFTDFPYLRPEWKKNCEEERLLGVSISGQMDNVEVLTVDALKAMKSRAIKVAQKSSKIMGINMPAAITCIKPEGTSSQITVSGSGLHTWYSPYFIRRYRISANDTLCKLLQAQKFPMQPENGQTEENVNTWVVSFPVKAPKGAIVKGDMNALQQLEHYKKVQTNYCEHNASATIYVKDDEWFDVGNWVYKNWDIVNGLSFLPNDGGKYKQAPLESITKDQYDEMVKKFVKIDYTKLSEFEQEDNTDGAKTLACTSGACEI